VNHKFDRIAAEMDRKSDELESMIDHQRYLPTSEYRGRVEQFDRSRLIAPEQKAADAFTEFAEEKTDAYGLDRHEADDFRLGAFWAALAAPSVAQKHLNEPERKAFSIAGGSATGGVLVPRLVDGRFLDEVRNKTRFRYQTMPLKTGAEIVFPAWDIAQPIKAGWRAEGDAFPDGGGALTSRTMSVYGLAVQSTTSIELIEDMLASNDMDTLSGILQSEHAKAIAVECEGPWESWRLRCRASSWRKEMLLRWPDRGSIPMSCVSGLCVSTSSRTVRSRMSPRTWASTRRRCGSGSARRRPTAAAAAIC